MLNFEQLLENGKTKFMKKSLRIRIFGTLVDITKSGTDIQVNLRGRFDSVERKESEEAMVHKYLHEEGIMDEIEAGNFKFAECILHSATELVKLRRIRKQA